MFVLHIILHLPLSPAGEYWKHFRGRPCLLSWQLYSVSFVVWLDHKCLGNQASVGSHLKVFQYCYAFTKKKKKCLHKHPFIAALWQHFCPHRLPGVQSLDCGYVCGCVLIEMLIACRQVVPVFILTHSVGGSLSPWHCQPGGYQHSQSLIQRHFC